MILVQLNGPIVEYKLKISLQLNSLYKEREISRILSFSSNYVVVCFNIHLRIGIMVYSRIILGTKRKSD
jgi:hypothetical protein